MSNVHSVCSFICNHTVPWNIIWRHTGRFSFLTWMPIMTNISNEVIDRMRVSVLNFRVTREELSHVNIPAGVRGHIRLLSWSPNILDGEIHNCWVLLNKKIILIESLHNVWLHTDRKKIYPKYTFIARIKYGGNLVSSNFFTKDSLYVLYSYNHSNHGILNANNGIYITLTFSVAPLNLLRRSNSGIWGMIFFSSSS